MLQQYLPFTVLKPTNIESVGRVIQLQQYLPFTVLKRIFCKINSSHDYPPELQQYLPFTVCDKGCEIAEGQSDDEVRTSLVPDRREGKTKVIR